METKTKSESFVVVFDRERTDALIHLFAIITEQLPIAAFADLQPHELEPIVAFIGELIEKIHAAGWCQACKHKIHNNP